MTAEPNLVRDRASAIRPLVVGDRLSGKQIAGFTWVQPSEADRYFSNHFDDRLLLDGDHDLCSPPDRAVPLTAEHAEHLGVVPPENAVPGQPADVVLPALSIKFDALLDLADAPWRPLIRPLLAAVYGGGHRLWLAGGAVRDVVAGRELHEVNDLDLSGTVPPGRFSDIVRQVLRAIGMSECETTVTPDSLVCSVRSRRTNARLLEYRALNRGGFRFPAVGSGLAEDAQHRDFAFNALFYDPMEHKIYDAGGSGLDDLRDGRRRFTTLKSTHDPVAQAEVILRGVKFAYRWRDEPDLCLSGYRNWVAALPPDLRERLTRKQRKALARRCREHVKDDEWIVTFAHDQLPEPGRALLLELIGGA